MIMHATWRGMLSVAARDAELLISKTWWDYSTVSNALGAVEVPKTPWQPDKDVQDWAPGTEDPILQPVSKITWLPTATDSLLDGYSPLLSAQY